MDIKILKPCVIDGKSYKPSKKKVTVSKKDGTTLVNLGKAEDLSPKEETLSVNLDIDVTALEEVQKELEAKDKEIEALKAQVETLTKEGEKN